MPLENYDQALDFLARMKLEPVWRDGPAFRKIAGMRGYNVTVQKSEKSWPTLVKLLGLNTRADTDRIRKQVRKRLGI